jgi:hypothetical protein
MGEENATEEAREIVLVNTQEPSFSGSGYDAGLQIDTTPASRVDWMAGGESESRGAYDARLITDTTPTTRPEPVAPPDTGVDTVSAVSSDQ